MDTLNVALSLFGVIITMTTYITIHNYNSVVNCHKRVDELINCMSEIKTNMTKIDERTKYIKESWDKLVEFTIKKGK